jgi:hypothetical protein
MIVAVFGQRTEKEFLPGTVSVRFDIEFGNFVTTSRVWIRICKNDKAILVSIADSTEVLTVFRQPKLVFRRQLLTKRIK